MPITIPPFTQYQAPLVPLRGLWNKAPKEGDKLINAEVNWSTATKQAVQIQLGNSPVQFSQIAAIYCDNSGCGSDVTFLFPDTAFSITIPANEQSLFPVLTNALNFFVIGSTAQLGDRTVIQVCNSVPPPIPLLPSSLAAANTHSGLNLAVNGSTIIFAAGVDGTIKTLAVSGWARASAIDQSCVLILSDGAGGIPWQATISAPNGNVLPFSFNPTLNARFINGLTFQVAATNLAAGQVTLIVYYTTP